MLHLASAVQPVLRDLAVPVLRALAEAVGCTAHLTVADGEEALALAVVEPSWTDFHVAYRVGSRHPLDQGAAGKAILLGREPDAAPYVVDVGRAAGRAPRAGRAGARRRGPRGAASASSPSTTSTPRASGEQVAAAAAEVATPDRLSLSGDHARPGPGGDVAVLGDVVALGAAHDARRPARRSRGARTRRAEPSGSAR